MFGVNYFGQPYFGEGPAQVFEGGIINPIIVVRHPDETIIVQERDDTTVSQRAPVGAILVGEADTITRTRRRSTSSIKVKGRR